MTNEQRLREALQAFLLATEPGAETGIHRMKELDSRLEFYDRISSVREQAHQALSNSTESKELEGWQPIETAPKDGTKILLGYFLEAGGSSWEVAFWHGTHNRWCGRVLLKADGYFSPTHWMPLPPPPSETGGKDE